MSNIKSTIILGFILLSIFVGVTRYNNKSSFSTLSDVKSLFQKGELATADEKVEELLKEDANNRQAIYMKSEIYKQTQYEKTLETGKEEYGSGVKALNSRFYNKAHKHFYNSMEHVNSIPENALVYNEAQDLGREVASKYNELSEKLAEQHYNGALKMYKNGEYMRAYEYLIKSPKETDSIATLKSDISFAIGAGRYSDIIKNPKKFPYTYYTDAIFWLEQVNTSSKNYKISTDMVEELKKLKSEY